MNPAVPDQERRSQRVRHRPVDMPRVRRPQSALEIMHSAAGNAAIARRLEITDEPEGETAAQLIARSRPRRVGPMALPPSAIGPEPSGRRDERTPQPPPPPPAAEPVTSEPEPAAEAAAEPEAEGTAAEQASGDVAPEAAAGEEEPFVDEALETETAPEEPVAVEAAPEAEAASEAGAGVPAPTGDVAAWRGSISARINAVSTPSIGDAASGAQRVRQRGAAAAGARAARGQNAVEDAQAAVTPAPQPESALPPPQEDPVPQHTQRIRDVSDRKLPDQQLPPIQQMPNGVTPEVTLRLAAEYSTAVTGGSQPAQPATAEAAAGGPARDRDAQRTGQARAVAQQPAPAVSAQAEPLTLTDEGPPPSPPIPAASRSDVAGVLAVLMADINGTATRIVEDAARAAYPRGILMTAYPDLAQEFTPDLETELTTQLNEIRELAGVSAQELDTKIAERRAELAGVCEETRTEVEAASSESTEAVQDEGQAELDAYASARESVDIRNEQQMEATAGTVDPSVIEAKRERLIRAVQRHVGPQAVRYTQAGERRDLALRDAGQAMEGAYIRAARQAEREAVTRTGSEEQGRAEVLPLFEWVRTRLNELRPQVTQLRNEAKNTADGYATEVRTAGSEGVEAIREWADGQLNQKRGWFERLIRRFRDWWQGAQEEAAAWEETRNQEARDGIARDLELLNTTAALEARGIDAAAIQGQAGLTDEQRAVLREYFEGPERGNPLVAIATGLRVRIANGRRPALNSAFERKLLDAPNDEWESVALIASTQSPGFNAYTQASELHAAMDQWGTDENRIWAALRRLGPLQSAALRKCYAFEFGRDLIDHLESELSGAEEDRALALLEGNQTMAVVFALREAMSGPGTDENTIMQALRGKTEEERRAIEAAYEQEYGRSLEDDLESEMSGHDLDRADALMEGDTARADAIAIDQAMHGGWLGAGTDEGQITGVYADIRQEVEAEAAQRGWTTAQMEAEILRRNRQVESAYGTQYGTGPDDMNAMRDAFRSDMSGPELDLALALAANDLVAADAARLAIEERGLYTDDDTVNNILSSQYQRARREVERDEALDLQRRDEIAALQGRPWSAQDRDRERTAMRERVNQQAQERANAYMGRLEQTFNSEYSRWGDMGLDMLIAMNMSGTEQEKARNLLEQGGRLTPEQEVRYAVQGAGTDEDALKRLLAGKSPAEVDEIRREWNRLHPDDPFDERILSEFSGRERFDMQLMLQGEPQTPQERIDRARQKIQYERDAYGAASHFAGEERARLERRLERLEETERRLRTLDPESQEYLNLTEQLDLQNSYFDRAVEDHRTAIDSATNLVATIVAVVVTVVVVVVLTVVTAGAAGVGFLAALGTVMTSASSAAAVAAAATAATVATKLVMRGSDYGIEEYGVDVAVGAVDALASAATAGLGGRLLQMGRLARLANSSKVLPRVFANVVSEGAEGFLGSMPAALTGTLLDDNTFRGEGTFGRILGGTLTGAGVATALSGGLGGLGGIARPARHLTDAVDTADVLARRGTPTERLAAWRSFQEANPGRTYDDFLKEWDTNVIAREAAADQAADLQRRLRGELLDGVPAAQRRQFANTPIEILSDEDFLARTGSRRGNSVVIFENGQPRVLMREGAPAGVLREEGIHLSQSLDPIQGARVRQLDETAMANWRNLDLEEQFRLFRTKIDLEIDAQHRLLAQLDDLLASAPDDAARRSILDQITSARRNLDNLSDLGDEAAGFTPARRMRITEGAEVRPAFLADPPRLFSKTAPPVPRVGIKAIRGDIQRLGITHPDAEAVLGKVRDRAEYDRMAAALGRMNNAAEADQVIGRLSQGLPHTLAQSDIPRLMDAVSQAASPGRSMNLLLEVASRDLAGKGSRLADDAIEAVIRRTAALGPAADDFLDSVTTVLRHYPRTLDEISPLIRHAANLPDAALFFRRIREFSDAIAQTPAAGRAVLQGAFLRRLAETVASKSAAQADRFLIEITHIVRTRPRQARILQPLLEIASAADDPAGFLQRLRRLTDTPEVPAFAINAIAGRARTLDRPLLREFIDTVVDLSQVRPSVRGPFGVFVQAAALTSQPARFLEGVRELLRRRVSGPLGVLEPLFSRRDLDMLARKALRGSFDPAFLAQLIRDHTSPFARDLFRFIAGDVNTPWRLFLRRLINPADPVVAGLFGSRLRGIAGEFFAQALPDAIRAGGVIGVVTRQARNFLVGTAIVPDFLVRVAGSFRAMEIKTYSLRFWQEMAAAFDSIQRGADVDDLIPSQRNAHDAAMHMLHQLRAANGAALATGGRLGQPILVITDSIDGLTPAQLNLIQQSLFGQARHTLVKVSEAEADALVRQIADLLGAP